MVKKNGRHILDLVQTHYLLKQVLTFIEDSAAQGKTFLFVGTKKTSCTFNSKNCFSL